MLVATIILAAALVTSCGGGSSTPPRDERSVLFVIDRGAQSVVAFSTEWTFNQFSFIPAAPLDGVTLGCDIFRREFSGPTDNRVARDSGYVYIHNGTGKTMHGVVATIESVEPDVGGVQRITFGSTQYEYGDIADGAGGPGPDGFALDGTEQEWFYTCDAEDTTEEYLANLRFTVKVSWLVDR
jgi:hypothetical protein